MSAVQALKQEDFRADESEALLRDTTLMLEVVQELSHLRDLDGVMRVVRVAARGFSGADGVTFILREGDKVFYADEHAIGPLWKGRRFPASCCISGWAIEHRQSVAVEDIYQDDRIPIDAYRSTFVKSLAVVPIRRDDPIGAIGAYWSAHHRATPRELSLLESLAAATAVAVANADLLRQVQQAVKVRDEFLELAAHELKTPLTPLGMQLDRLVRLADRGADPETWKAEVRQARAYGERLQRLVQHLLDLESLAKARPHLEPEEFGLGEVLRELLEEMDGPLRASQTKVSVVGAEEQARGRWDRLRIKQVLRILLSNATKFGAGKPVTVELETREKSVLVRVRDQGMGIGDQVKERLFTRFARAVSADHFGGLGASLWIARQLVIAHGGSICVESAQGQGATFVVELPR